MSAANRRRPPRPEQRAELDRSRGPPAVQSAARAGPRRGGQPRSATLARGVERRIAGGAAHGAAGARARSVRAFCTSIRRRPPTPASRACARRRRSCRSIARNPSPAVRPSRRSAGPPICPTSSMTPSSFDGPRRSPRPRDGPPRISLARHPECDGKVHVMPYPVKTHCSGFDRRDAVRASVAPSPAERFRCSSSAAIFRAKADQNCWTHGGWADLPAAPCCTW